MLEIVKAPNPVLSGVAKPISKIDQQTRAFIAEMKKALLATRDPEGVGLAAPQVGKPLQIFIIKPTKTATIRVFINPVITQNKSEQNAEQISVVPRKVRSRSEKLEGCLSLPHIWGIVNRTPTVTLSYMDEQGKKHTTEFKGFVATIIQHETDHLNGILFPRRVLEQKEKLYKSKRDKNGEDIFEEIEL